MDAPDTTRAPEAGPSKKGPFSGRILALDEDEAIPVHYSDAAGFLIRRPPHGYLDELWVIHTAPHPTTGKPTSNMAAIYEHAAEKMVVGWWGVDDPKTGQPLEFAPGRVKALPMAVLRWLASFAGQAWIDVDRGFLADLEREKNCSAPASSGERVPAPTASPDAPLPAETPSAAA